MARKKKYGKNLARYGTVLARLKNEMSKPMARWHGVLV